MDTLQYLQAQSGLTQELMNKLDERNAKNEEDTLRDDTLGSLGLPSSTELLKSALTTDSMKSTIKNALKTGDDDIDSAVSAVIDGEKNPLDAIEKLFGKKVGDAVRNVKSNLPEGLADGEESDSPTSLISALGNRVKDTISSFLGSPDEMISKLKTGINQIKSDALSNPRATLEDAVSDPSGTLDSASGTARGILGQVSEGLGNIKSGILGKVQDARDAISGIRGKLPQRNVMNPLDDEFNDDNLMQDTSDFHLSSLMKNPPNVPRDDLPFPDVEPEPTPSTTDTIEDPQLAEQPKQQDGDGDVEEPKETATIDDADASDMPQDDLITPAEPTSEVASDALASTGADIADATDAIDAVSAGLDADPLTAPIGALIGLGSLIGSIFGMTHHRSSSVDVNSLGSAVFTAGI